MPKDWSRSALDDLYLEGVITRPIDAIPFEHLAARRRDLRLPAMCLLAGVMAALLYVWPVLIMTQILAGGMRSAIFWPALAGGAALASLAAWAITTYENGYWARNWHKVGDWADPPTWK